MKRAAFLSILVAAGMIFSSATLAADRAVLCVQQQLNALGFDAGPADGIIGRRSIAAGDEYRAYMRAQHPGWTQPGLTAPKASLWCEKVAAAHPGVARYWSAFKAGDAAAARQLVGTWRLDVTCPDFKQVNTVRIKRADASTVLGTTNVDDGYGDIVDGGVRGTEFTFTNTYLWEGRRYSEIWSGRLSRGNSVMTGRFTTTNTASGDCRFSGQRR